MEDENMEAQVKINQKEVIKGYIISILKEAVEHLNFSCVIPVGITVQWTIDTNKKQESEGGNHTRLFLQTKLCSFYK